MKSLLLRMFGVWKLRDIVLAAILAVVCGAIYLGWDELTNLIPATVSPVWTGLLNGIWWIASGLVAYIVQRPLAAFFAEVVGAVCEFAFGSPYGTGAIISGLLQGAGAEVGFALAGWRLYNVGILMLSGLLGGVGNCIQYYYQYGGDKLPLGTFLGYGITTLVSGAIFAGVLPKLIVDRLRNIGVLRNYEVGKSRVRGE